MKPLPLLLGFLMTHLTVHATPSALFTPRNGLPNTAAKLESGEELTVVFIGGSVTQGGGAAGYVAATEAWLKQQWPKAVIRVVNAGLSGTGSDFGAKRYDRDVLVHKPDLVLIEFAVNDGQSDSRVHMERMVHKTWLQDPETDLVFFYNLSRAHLDDYRNGQLPRAAGFHEQVAIHYGIPTIGLAHALAAKLETGEVEWSQFANDAVHPHAGGYGFYNATFQEVLPQLLQSGKPGPHTLRKPITKDLVVYPPPIEAVPQNLPAFQDANGQAAITSFAAPSPGVHWIEEPVFSTAEGKTLWRLHWMEKERSAAMDATIGQKKADWAPNPMAWFFEEGAYTGPEGNPLYSRTGQGTMLGFSGKEVAVLVFVAPETGRYAYRVASDQLQAWQNEDTDFALHLLHFPWGEDAGTSQFLYRAKRREVEPFTRAGELHLVAGEELVVVVGSNTPGYIRGGWVNFQFNIGLMPKD
jgi:lysophospholipase L1-like esterase